MNVCFPENFFLVPDTGIKSATLYELQLSASEINNSVVLIPYQQKLGASPQPLFFKITKKEKINFDFAKEVLTEKIKLEASISKEAYLKKVNILKDHIKKGNVYEVNYCLSISGKVEALDPVTVFHHLHTLSRAPYAALLKIGNQYIISASPELFLRKENKLLYTKPIKGTIKRGTDKIEDEKLKNELYLNIKERTENVMAVDVARNDLSVIATRGSVKVNKLYNIETFETVHQMVSTVSCEIKPDKTFTDILKATFPMASMTGAPKKSAMDLIDEHESFIRNQYSGAIGIIDEKGDFELSVIIRSIFYDAASKELSIAVGSAITYLSDPEQEYEECLLKAKALLTALNAKIQ